MDANYIECPFDVDVLLDFVTCTGIVRIDHVWPSRVGSRFPAEPAFSRRPRGERHMDGESHRQQLRSTPGAGPRSRLAACTAVGIGIALSAVTVALAALNAISARQALAMAFAAVLITLGGTVGRIVPDASIAWRRGFRRGCEAAAALTSQADLIRADDAANQVPEAGLAKVVTFPGPGRTVARTAAINTRQQPPGIHSEALDAICADERCGSAAQKALMRRTRPFLGTTSIGHRADKLNLP